MKKNSSILNANKVVLTIFCRWNFRKFLHEEGIVVRNRENSPPENETSISLKSTVIKEIYAL